jgi:carbon-monoxide dehydrogenase medium subunit
MRDFFYLCPTSLDEARGFAAAEGAMLLAGGQTLLRDMKNGAHSPASLVDIARVVPNRIEIEKRDISIGAGATHAEVAAYGLVRQHLPVLAGLVGHIGDPAVRHRGTLGGAVGANEPAGDYPAACLALGATIHTTARSLEAVDFFIDERRTALQHAEIIIHATFPIAKRAAYVKFLNPASRYAMVGVFAALAADGSPRVAITGASVCGAFRWREAELALATTFEGKAVEGVRLPPGCGLIEDFFADAEYRSRLTAELTRRAVVIAANSMSGVVVLSHGLQMESS